MPRMSWMSDAEYEAYERCLEKLKNKPGINRYAVCMASIKEKHERLKKKALNRLGEQRMTRQRR